MRRASTKTPCLLVAMAAAFPWLLPAQTPSNTPSYVAFWADAVTGDNSFVESGETHWFVDPGADVYASDIWERPTESGYEYFPTAMKYGTTGSYYANLDIVQGLAGFDQDFVYFAIDLYGNDRLSNGTPPVSAGDGLAYFYRIRLSTNTDGDEGWLLVTEQPESKLGTTWGQDSVKGYRDTNGDLTVDGDGYDLQFISDGQVTEDPYTGSPNVDGQDILWARVSPSDDTIVELALKYSLLNLTEQDLEDLPYLVFETGKSFDPANYFWNQEYTGLEAGSPNYGGTGDQNEFGGQGLGNLSELDTVRATAGIPEPSTLALLLAGLTGILLRRRRA